MRTTLQLLRILRGQTQREIAAAIGISARSLSKIENAVGDASRPTQVQLERIFGFSYSELVSRPSERETVSK
jgi:transcriptional regulator with XRE-family HTH domain